MSKSGEMAFGFVFDDEDDEEDVVSSEEEGDEDYDEADCNDVVDDVDFDDCHCSERRQQLPPGYSFCKNCRSVHPIPGYKKNKNLSIIKDTFNGPPSITLFKVLSVTNNGVKLSWSTKNLELREPITSFLVQMDFNSQVSTSLFETVYDGSGTEYEVPNLLSGTLYNFRIQAWDKKGMSKWSTTISATTLGPKSSGMCFYFDSCESSETKRSSSCSFQC